MSTISTILAAAVKDLLRAEDARFDDGTIKRDDMLMLFTGELDSAAALESTDFETVEAEFRTILLENPNLRTIPLSQAVEAIWESRDDAGRGVKPGMSLLEKSASKAAARERLEYVFTNWLRQSDWCFYGQGRGGILIYQVPGEEQTRMSDEDWAKVEGRKEAAAERKAKKAEKKAEKEAAKKAA